MEHIQIKRVYEPPAKTDGFRVLVDRVWPRGLSKSDAAVDLWMKDVAPSTELRKWFNHEPARWKVFQEKYRAELRQRSSELDELKAHAAKRTPHPDLQRQGYGAQSGLGAAGSIDRQIGLFLSFKPIALSEVLGSNV